ncbi:unnamed protein product [Prorocentrum cordatum]|uniref:Subtilisin n=1 Tax=Prorocentrum cordatum TaxID=2364126 RepID=A0ABN9QFV0_9DINO|nr:unnamed protein product [Polarella glacialis]
MSSIVYKTAKKTGLEAALSVPVSDITITGFELDARRLSTAVRQLSDTVSVKTRFKVRTTSISDANALSTRISGASTVIKEETDSAMAESDWSGESVLTAAPTIAALTTLTVVAITTESVTSFSTMASTTTFGELAATAPASSSADSVLMIAVIVGAS